MSSAAVVAATRIVQRTWFSDYRHVSVRIDLPGLNTSQISFGGHLASAKTSSSGVDARMGATGLLTTWSPSGVPTGLDVIPASPLLRNVDQTVDYTSTAEALVELTFFPAPSPVLSALIRTTIATSPGLPAFAAELHEDSTTRPDYLTHLNAAEQSQLAAIGKDVQSQLASTFGRAAQAPATTTSVAGTSLAAQSLLTPDVPMLDQFGHTACTSHAIADALCLEALPAPHGLDNYLQMTNWTQSWQLVYRTSDLQTLGRVAAPVALLQPAANAPPSLSGIVAATVTAGTTQSLDDHVCHQESGAKTPNNWVKPSACTSHAWSSAILSQLTLTAQSSMVQTYVSTDSGLYDHGLTVVGLFSPASALPANNTPAEDLQELAASSICLGLTTLTQVVIPIVQMVLDEVISSRGHGESEDESRSDSQERQTTDDSMHDIAALERARDDAALRPVNESRSAAELEKAVPGLDEADASALIADRALHGQDVDLERIESVPGIAPDRFAFVRADLEAQADSEAVQRDQIPVENDAKSAESYFDKHREDAEESALTELTDDFLDDDEMLQTLVEDELKGEHEVGFLKSALVATLAVTKKLPELFPIVFPQFSSPENLAGVLAGAAASYGLAFVPGADVLDGIDEFMGDVADVQNDRDLAATLESGDWIHTYQPLDTLQIVGSKNVPGIYQLVASEDHITALLGETLLGAAGSSASLNDLPLVTKTAIVAVDPSGTASYTLAPANIVNSSTVINANTSQAAELHLGLSGASSIHQAALDGIEYDVLESDLPLGEGPVTFAPAPAVHQRVLIADEGAEPNVADRAGVVSAVFMVNQAPVAVAFQVTLDGMAPPTPDNGAGGLVYDEGRPADGQLVGLAQVQQGNTVTVLTGVGVRFLACQAHVGSC